MEVRFRTSFTRDIARIRDANMHRRIQRVIAGLDAAPTILGLPGVAAVRGHAGYYRIRIGAYRLGIAVEGETVVLVRFLHRRDVYRSFP